MGKIWLVTRHAASDIVACASTPRTAPSRPSHSTISAPHHPPTAQTARHTPFLVPTAAAKAPRPFRTTQKRTAATTPSWRPALQPTPSQNWRLQGESVRKRRSPPTRRKKTFGQSRSRGRSSKKKRSRPGVSRPCSVLNARFRRTNGASPD